MSNSEILYDVAARIIQHYWRLSVASRKRQQTVEGSTTSRNEKTKPCGTSHSTNREDPLQRLHRAASQRGLRKPPKPHKPTAGRQQQDSTSGSATVKNLSIAPESTNEKVVAVASKFDEADTGSAPRLEDSAEHVTENRERKTSLEHSVSKHGFISNDEFRVATNTAKMASIISLLDQLESQASQEAAAVLSGTHLTAFADNAQTTHCRHKADAHHSNTSQANPNCMTIEGTVGKLPATIRNSNCSREVTDATGHSTQISSSATATVFSNFSSVPSFPEHVSTCRMPCESELKDAAAVADGVRGKIQRLQQQVQEKDRKLAEHSENAQRMQDEYAQQLAAAQAQYEVQLQQQKSEHEAAVTRNMTFIDRILSDKDAVSAKCENLARELATVQSHCARQIDTLKDDLSKELKKQKELWLAAERSKRNAWVAEQTKLIKASTVRGLEPEIQRLVEIHKADLRKLEIRLDTECTRRLKQAALEHEQQLVQVREQYAAEKSSALEQEKVAANEQVKDAQKRFELELQGLRMRLAADHEMQLDRADAARREDRNRADERQQQLERECEQRISQLRCEMADERSAAVRQHQKDLEALKEKYETGQEAWRAAMAERAKHEFEQREVVLRRQLERERDEEIREVIARLEAEYLAKEEALQAHLSDKEAAVEARWEAEVTRLRQAEQQVRGESQAAGSKLAAAEEKVCRLEEWVHTLQREVNSKATSTTWLEEQVSAAKREVAFKEELMREALAQQAQAAAEQRAALEQRVQELHQQLEGAQGEVEAVQARKAEELEALEARVRAALAKKDEQVAALKQHLASITQQLSEAGLGD